MHENLTSGLLSTILTILVVSAFIHFGAKSMVGDRGFGRAIFVAVVGSLLAGLIWISIHNTLGLFLGIAAWTLVAAVTYRTSWLRGLGIGVIAWILWAVVSWVVSLVF